MFSNYAVIPCTDRVRSNEEIRRQYGQDAIISRVGRYTLIHLDNPKPEEVQRRVEEFSPEELFEDDCPICRMLRDQPGDVVYDDFSGDEADDGRD